MSATTNHNESDQNQRDLEKVFLSYLDRQLELCLELEAIADSLPDAVNPQACLDVAQRLLPLIRRAHDFEEALIFPPLLKEANTLPDLKESLDRLRYEHWGDEDFAQDLATAIRAYVAEQNRSKADGLSWMLRGFFEGVRRHIAFEREHILPLTRQLGKAAHG